MWQIIILITFGHCSNVLRQPLRVHEGVGDLHNEFLFAVSLQNYKGARLCTGSLIALNWVLSAAHCMDEKEYVIMYTNFTITAGSVRVAKVLKIILHPGFLYVDHFQVLHNDIALIQTTAIYNKAIGKLSAIDYRALVGLPVKYAGFGGTSLTNVWTEEDEYRPLQVGEAVVSRPNDPYSDIGPIIHIAPKCSKRNQGIRGGDSGGPLIYDGKIIGVAMWSYDVFNIANYAAVSTFLEWIHNTMRVHGYKPKAGIHMRKSSPRKTSYRKVS